MLKGQTEKTIKKHSMLSPGDAVLVCVSGGPDSTCLLHVLHSLKNKYKIKLAVCHINHMIRKNEAEADARFVEKMAKAGNFPFFSCRKNARLRARRKNLSLEEAAREIRYEFFEKTAKTHGIDKIALGHNMDDRAETVLLNLLRGTGLDGMAGVPPVRELGGKGILVIRPLLESPREEIICYLKKSGLDFRTDSSNTDPVFSRNRVRLELIPYIESNFEPEIKQKLSKTAGIIAEYKNYFRLAAAESLKKRLKTKKQAAEIEISGFKGLHPVVKRVLLQEAFNAASGKNTPLSAAHIEQLRGISESTAPSLRLNLPCGVTASREYEKLQFRKKIQEIKAPGAPLSVIIPGKNPVPGLGMSIVFTILLPPADFDASAAANLDFAKIKLPAAIRRRKDGDRFSPFGMKGSKKLKKFLIDKKIPLEQRDSLPILVDADENIICVLLPLPAPAAIDNKYKITKRTKQILQVRIV